MSQALARATPQVEEFPAPRSAVGAETDTVKCDGQRGASNTVLGQLDAMELNLLMWRCGDRARMYMAVPLIDSPEYNSQRQQCRDDHDGVFHRV